MQEHLTITALRARGLPRSLLLLPPSPQLEIHTSPGASPVAKTPALPRTTDPTWRPFRHIHTVAATCGPVYIGLVIRDASSPSSAPLGRLTLTIATALTEGWFPLSGDDTPTEQAASSAAEVYVRVVRPSCCRMRLVSCPVSAGNLATLSVETAQQGELRECLPWPGCLFRVGELVVSVAAAGVPATATQLSVVLETEEQSLRGGETPASLEQSGKGDTVREAEDGSGTDNAVVVAEEEGAADKPDGEVWHSGNRRRIAMMGVEKVVGRARGEYERLTKSEELRRLTKVAGELARGITAGEGSSGERAFTGEVKEKAADGEDIKALLGVEEGGGGDAFAGCEDDAEEEDDVEEDDDEEDDDDDYDEYDYDYPATSKSNEQEAADRPHHMAEDASGTGTLRRDADFGSFRFGLLQGSLPRMLHIKIQEKASRLPPPLALLRDHTIRMPPLSTFQCTCEQNCHSHMFRLRLCGPGLTGGKIIVHVHIAYRGWKPHAESVVVTPRFKEVFSDRDRLVRIIRDQFPLAKGLTYMFVGGLFTKHYPTYFDNNIQFLQDQLQFPHVKTVPIHTEGSIARNARIIKDAVMDAANGPKSVVLIGHSKGGVDAISVLHQFPEAIPFLQGIISFQAPFGGTYLIDFVEQRKIAVKAISHIIASLWKGDEDAIHDLGYSARLRAMKVPRAEKPIQTDPISDTLPSSTETLEPILDFDATQADEHREHLDALRSVPIIAFASRANFNVLRIRSAANAAGVASMAPAAQVITQKTGFFCDGLVTPADARVPYADVVLLDDMMHTEPALYVKGTKYPPGPLTAAAIILLLEKANKSARD